MKNLILKLLFTTALSVLAFGSMNAHEGILVKEVPVNIAQTSQMAVANIDVENKHCEAGCKKSCCANKEEKKSTCKKGDKKECKKECKKGDKKACKSGGKKAKAE